MSVETASDRETGQGFGAEPRASDLLQAKRRQGSKEEGLPQNEQPGDEQRGDEQPGGAENDSDRPRVDLGTYQKQRDWPALVRRGLWTCVQFAFWPKRPRWLSGLRVALLRLFGASIGEHVLICGGVRVTVPWLLELADYAVLGDDVEVYNLAKVTVGTHAVVSQRVYLCTATHDYTLTDFPLYAKPITIGAQSWVAAGAFVGPGLTIGEGAVVGAKSVVTRDVAPWMVSAGNPSRVIKPRELRER